MYLGAHLGISGGLAEAALEAQRIGCESLQVFSKSPQMWDGPPIPATSAASFRDAVRSVSLRATAVHHGYLLNLANPSAVSLRRSRSAFADELARAELLGVDALIFHAGAHLGSGPAEGVKLLAESLNDALERAPGGSVRLLVENSAGQGTTLGSTLEELKGALSLVEAKERVGVTLDTCHLFAAGFDLRTESGYGTLVDRIDATIGREAVRAFHLNDAKAPVGSHLDRHENIGKGEIGSEGFRALVNDPRWADRPGYLETPLDERDYARYREDLATLRSLLSRASKPRARPRAPPRRASRASTVK